MKRWWTRVAVVAAVACSEPIDAGPASFVPTLSSRELWSGGELQVSTVAFANADVIVVLGSDTLFRAMWTIRPSSSAYRGVRGHSRFE